jgi:transaldolase
MANKNIETLNEIGQSVWYDNLSRDVLNSGQLKALIDAGVSGLTSNPTIFKKAIADTADYDGRIRELGAALSDEEVTEALMIEDVAAAADLLRPCYDRSRGRDGFASIEVSPLLARDAEGTIAAARRLWHALKRPNVMIKIPGTRECLPAIRTALSEGINVNITLLFSVTGYEAVLEQYQSAIEARIASGQAVERVASVASFFVSRVDTITEQAIARLGERSAALMAQFRARIGIANAWLAYDSFERCVATPRFAAIREKGAQAQRPLWASTGTKSADLPALLYVEGLAAAQTVNTMPPATVKALVDAPALTCPGPAIAGSRQLLAELEQAGIKLQELLMELEVAGVKLFADSYNELLEAVAGKRKRLA